MSTSVYTKTGQMRKKQGNKINFKGYRTFWNTRSLGAWVKQYKKKKRAYVRYLKLYCTNALYWTKKREEK